MKRNLKSILVPLFAVLFFSIPSHSQDITGIWRGNFFSEGGSQYRIEVQLELKGNKIAGVTYSYHTTDFYGKAIMTGNFNKELDKVLFEEIKTVEVKMSGLSSVCIMKYNLVYSRSGKEEFLEGTYSSVYEKNGLGGRKGEECGDGRVYLRKVPTSDFYVEPFLRNKDKSSIPTTTADSAKPKSKVPATSNNKTNTTPNKTNTTPKNSITVKPKTPGSTTTKTNTKPSTTKSSNPTTLKKTNIDTIKSIPKINDGGDKQAAKTPQITTPKPAILKSRQNELVNTFTVNDENITVKLYDNGEIDGDSISVYLDNKIMLSHQRLTASPLQLKLKMDEENDEHELIMVAENLGRIPPNTSLMIVEAGDQRFTARITSTYQKNAMVRFKYVKK